MKLAKSRPFIVLPFLLFLDVHTFSAIGVTCRQYYNDFLASYPSLKLIAQVWWNKFQASFLENVVFAEPWGKEFWVNHIQTANLDQSVDSGKTQQILLLYHKKKESVEIPFLLGALLNHVPSCVSYRLVSNENLLLSHRSGCPTKTRHSISLVKPDPSWDTKTCIIWRSLRRVLAFSLHMQKSQRKKKCTLKRKQQHPPTPKNCSREGESVFVRLWRESPAYLRE
jgi:hypothetical protein